MGQEFESDRLFRLWDILVSHDHLLLRSPKDETHEKNCDIIFRSVRFMMVPGMFRGLRIEIIKAWAAPEIVRPFVSDKHEKHLFRVSTAGAEYFIAASHFRVVENDLDPMTTSLNALE